MTDLLTVFLWAGPESYIQNISHKNKRKRILHFLPKHNGNAFATYGPAGVIVRIGDKINRLMNITKNGVNMVDNETIEDTFLDLHNYSAMAVMLLRDGST